MKYNILLFREYRDVKVASAVTACYRDMAARHRARTGSVQIMRVEIVPSNKCRRKNIKQFHVRIDIVLYH